MDCDGIRQLDGRILKNVCLGGVICLGELLAEDIRKMLPKGGPLAEAYGSSCGTEVPRGIIGKNEDAKGAACQGAGLGARFGFSCFISGARKVRLFDFVVDVGTSLQMSRSWE